MDRKSTFTSNTSKAPAGRRGLERLGVSKDVLADWEASRTSVPDETATIGSQWWKQFLHRAMTGIDKTLDLIESKDGAVSGVGQSCF